MGLRESVAAPLRNLFQSFNSVESVGGWRARTAWAGEVPSEFTVVDVETTGLDPENDRIIQVAAIRVGWDGTVIDSFDTVVRPENPETYEHGAEHIHGISADAVARGMPVGQAMSRLARSLDGSILTGHNVRFDIGFLAAECRRAGVALTLSPWIDTLWLARQLDPEKQHSHRLGDLCNRYGIPVTKTHDALADATATAALLFRLLPQHGITSPDNVGRVLRTSRA